MTLPQRTGSLRISGWRVILALTDTDLIRLRASTCFEHGKVVLRPLPCAFAFA